MDIFREALDACERLGVAPFSITLLHDDAILVTGNSRELVQVFADLVGFVNEVGKDGFANVFVPDGRVRFLVRLPAGGMKKGDVVRIPPAGRVVLSIPAERVLA